MNRTEDIGSALERSLDARWKRFQKELKDCRKTPTERATHDLRVSMRRLISTIDVLRALLGGDGARKLRRLLKKNLRMFRELRDVQVQILAVKELLPGHPALAPYRDLLAHRERGLVKKVGRRARAVRAGRFGATLGPLRRRLRKLSADEAGRENCLTAAIGAVDAAFGRVLGFRERAQISDLEAVHRMRIAFKKFRYAVEALQPVLAVVTSEKLRRMHDFQLLLGRIHDNQVLAEDVRAHAGRSRKAKPLLDAVVTELSARREALLESLRKSLDEVPAFWIGYDRAAWSSSSSATASPSSAATPDAPGTATAP